MGGESVATVLVVDEVEPAQLLEPGVERAWIGLARALQTAEGQRLTAELPQDPERPPPAEDVERDRDRPARHRSATWPPRPALHSEEAIIELFMLAGFYRTVGYLVNGLRLPLEPGTARFADVTSDERTA